MIDRHGSVWAGAAATWLAALLFLGIGALAWFGYRATDQWQRSSALLADHRSQEAANFLMMALTRDMRGVQTSLLNRREIGPRVFAPPYEVNDLVAVAFARYPYPELFLGWADSGSDTVVYARTDRFPTWLHAGGNTDVYPVQVVRDPPNTERIRTRIESDILARRRYSIFELPIGGVPYQVIAAISYHDVNRERLECVFGFLVNLDWVRARYFGNFAQQVAQVPGSTSGTTYGISDERGAQVAGVPPTTAQGTQATRRFPVAFFDPALIAVDLPDDLPLRSWTLTASPARDATVTLAARGARQSLYAMAAAVFLLGASLLVTVLATRASAALSSVRADFVSTVTHELKTPLSTIRAIGERLIRNRVRTEEDLKLSARLLVREERRLTRLVNNLLAYSRVTDVTEVYSFETHDPSTLVTEALQGFRRQLTDSDFRLEVDVPSDIPSVRADRTSMVLALDNLIDNAIRYSADAKAVSIRACATESHVRFEVIDRGVGIPTDELPQVKRRFVRGRTARGNGNGLGLAIVNRIAADHDGVFQIASTVGAGTTATLVIPRARA